MEANILVTQPNPLSRSLSQTLVSAGRKTLVAFTRTSRSMVRPEAAAIPKRATKTRSFWESLMAGGASCKGQEGGSGHSDSTCCPSPSLLEEGS